MLEIPALKKQPLVFTMLMIVGNLSVLVNVGNFNVYAKTLEFLALLTFRIFKALEFPTLWVLKKV